VPSGPAAARPAEGGDARRVALWLGGRLVVATLILGGHLLTTQAGVRTFTGHALSGLIVATYAATLGSAFALWRMSRRDGTPNPLARDAKGDAEGLRVLGNVQVALDLALELGLVWLVGGVVSAFTFLFGITTLTAAVLVGPGAARAAAAWSVVLYVTLSVGTANDWLPQPPDQAPAQYGLADAEYGFALVRNVAGLAVVGMLASYLAARLRRTGGELVRAAESAAALARLNDDIVRSIPAGLLTTDERDLIRTANPAAGAILQVGERELLGVPLSDFLTVQTDDASVARRAETTARRRDGSTFPAGYTRTSLLDAAGNQLGGLVVFQDLSEVTTLREAAERAERLAQLGRIAAGLAHEIRNPLGSISGSVQLVREAAELGAEDRRLLGIVVAEVERLDDLVATMLQLGRPRALEREVHDLRVIAREVVDVARVGIAQTSGITLEVDAPETPVPARVDSAQVRQIIWNLVKNAVQASPSCARVRVLVRPTEDGGAVVEVHDEGHGVSRDSLPRLFEAFYTQRAQGTGLGLALVKQIADAHGASVEVESPPAVTGGPSGATFRITFPAC
jgi:two-component system sensor histidine kinase PilS (NtrC family)